MNLSYYITVLFPLLIFHYQVHYSESLKFKNKKLKKSTKLSSSNSNSKLFTSNDFRNIIHFEQYPSTLDNYSSLTKSTTEAYDQNNGIHFNYFNTNTNDSISSNVIHDDNTNINRVRRGSNSDGNDNNDEDEYEIDLTKATKIAGVLLGGLKSKLVVKIIFGILSKFPGLLALPALTWFSFLLGVLFGRLSAGIINPTVVTTPATTTTTTTTTTAPTTTTASTTTASTTTTVAPTTGMVNLFFGTNLSGGGAGLTAPVGVCVDFPAAADNMVSSMDLLGTSCIIICDLAGCTGTCYQITGATVINDLGSFAMMMSSLMFC